ncbi:alpha/beta hydrolase [Microbacteriaceae bacterium VKM Ac-2854]|nr:alpha/beta hydrolase [Microbacteriaceae bacterium VKM Ac-2854]
MSPSAPSRPGRIALLALIGAVGLSTVVATPATATTADCSRSLPAGTSTVSVPFAGTNFDVLVHVPDVAADESLPLVLDLHGSNSNGTVQAGISGLADVADAEHFIVAEPTGAIAFPTTLEGGNWAWNVPGVPLTSGTLPPDGSRDDVAFLSTVVESLSASGCVDPGSVFATGYSGGGRMASALACTRADLFAAVAPVAGLRAGRADTADLSTIEAGSCAPSQPVSVVTFHGIDDAVNPYLGNTDPRWGFSVPVAAAGWAVLDECDTVPTETTITEQITLTTAADCADGTAVELYTIAGAGHTWPGTAVDLEASGLGVVNRDISASQLMWDFFAAHARSSAVTPTPEPTVEPTAEPTVAPTAAPTPTSTPTAVPTVVSTGSDGSALAATGVNAAAPLWLALGLLLLGGVGIVRARRHSTR